MASELQLQSKTGWTVYAIIRNFIGQVWNGSGWEAYATGNLGTYDIPMTEQGTASGFYVADFPPDIAVMTIGQPYGVAVYHQLGGSPAEGDALLGTGEIHWKLVESGVLGTLHDFYEVVTFGTVVDESPTALAFETDLTEVTDNHYHRVVCVFRTGVLKGQPRDVKSDTGTPKKITVETAYTDAPGNGDKFVLVGLIA